MNKALKVFKAIDVFGQLACVLLPLLLARYTAMFTIVLVLGSWQFASFVVHIPFWRQPWIAKGRKIYGILLFLVICLAFLALVSGGILFFFLFVFAWIAIAMGGFYLIISFLEWQKMKRISVQNIKAEF
ncbi:MAG: hypothetical protein ABI378_04010 [Chitinophagaceae bacterium]